MDQTSIIYKYLNVSPLIAVWGTDYETVEKWVDANKVWGSAVFLSPSRIIEKDKKQQPAEIGEYIRNVIFRNNRDDNSVYVARNCHFGLVDDPCRADIVLMDLLIEVYALFKPARKTLLFTGPAVKLHQAIRPFVREFYWPALGADERRNILGQALKSAHNRGKLKTLTPELVDGFVPSLEGFSAREINEAMAVSYLNAQGSALLDCAVVGEMRLMTEKESFLEREMPDGKSTDRIIGFENIEKAMTAALRNITQGEGRIYGRLPLKNNFLVYGYSGTGKTGFAKHFCAKHGLPHYSLKVSQIRHENFGESEKRLEAAFAELRGVCARSGAVVLAVNEFEKLLAVGSADNSAHRAQIAQVLNFLGGEKPDNLIVYATANRIDGIRQSGEELLRRFSVFFSGLPDYETRKKLIAHFTDAFTGGKHKVDEESIDALAQALGRMDAATLREAILKSVCECGEKGKVLDGAALRALSGIEGVYKKHEPYAKELHTADAARAV